MKIKITIILFLLILTRGTFAQMTTNKIVRTMTITSSNSALEVGFYFTAGVAMANTASPQPFTHGLANFNPANVVCTIQNTSPIGISGFHFKNSLGVDTAVCAFENSSSNYIVRNFPNGRRMALSSGGSPSNFLYIQDTVTTNTGNFVVGGNVTFNGAITNNGGAVSSVLSTNVMADFPLIAAAAFSDISYPLTGTITNMVCNLGNPAFEDGSLILDSSIPSNGFVRIRARNVGAVAADQGNLPYRIHVIKTPAE